MKIVVIGGSGLVGASVVEILQDQDEHEVVAASRRTGVDAFTGEGLAEALAGVDVVVDVVNAPSFEDEVAQPFFETSTRNLLTAGAAAGVGHHIALSIVGAERLVGSGYFRAKQAQEQEVRIGPTPYTILRATQFFEFLGAIARDGERDDEIHLASARIQPIAADDVAIALSKLARTRPANATIEVAGPDSFRLDGIVRDFMAATGDETPVLADPNALYFGTLLDEETLMAGDTPRFGNTEFDRWLRRWLREHPGVPARNSYRLTPPKRTETP